MQGRGIVALNERSREILRHIVEAYVETGEPVGSRTLSRRLGMVLSPATIRNVMADLEESGLLHAPHASAGRLPTDAGLRFFVDGLLEIGGLTDAERSSINAQCSAAGRSMAEVLEEASAALSGLSHCAGLITSPKLDSALKHIEFVPLSAGRALVVMVAENGLVENRVIELPADVPMSSLIEATNYLSSRLTGRSLDEARAAVKRDLDEQRAEIDALTKKVVEAGLATWAGGQAGSLIIRGQARLLEDVTALEDLERIRVLFRALETRESVLKLVDATAGADGVQIFIGAENSLFNMSGCSMIVAPYRDSRERIVGAIGVIGPTRMHYARIIPLVDYTAKVVGRLLG